MTLLHETAYVYEVYRQRSFTRAAQALYISQPSLSQMIRKAEGRIGTTIFDRSTSPIGLTEAGRAYIRAAEQVLQIESDLRRYLDDAERCITGVLTLGGAMLFTSYVLPPLLSAFSERYPGVELRLHEAPTARLKEQLQEGKLDFAVDNSAFDPAVYEARLFKREQVILAVPRAFAVNEAAARFRLSAADLLREETPRAFDASCEQCFLVEAGSKTVVLGPGSLEQAHTIDEFVEKEQLLSATALYQDLAIRVLVQGKLGAKA